MKISGAMFLVNSDGKVLLVHPSGSHNRDAPWMPPKEQIEGNESVLDAARRAVSEELGLTEESFEDVQEFGSIRYRSRTKTVYCFSARYKGGDKDITLDWENDRYDWFTFEDAKRVIKEEFSPVIDAMCA